MTEDDLRKILYQLLKKIAPDTEPDNLKPEDNIRHVLGIDSFDYLSFIVALDEELGIQTPEEDYGKIVTLKALMAYIFEKKKATK